jgi:hypothetical protein
MILFIAVSIYLPTLGKSTSYNFLYASGYIYYTSDRYDIKNNKLEVRPQPSPSSYGYELPDRTTKLHIYDVTSHTSRDVTTDEASQLTLDDSPISPDGFEIVNGSRSGGFFPFFYTSTNYDTYYLKGGASSKKLNLDHIRGYNNFRFIGWIK